MSDNDDDETLRMDAPRLYASASVNRSGSGMPAPFKLVNCYACVDCPKVDVLNTSTKLCPYTNDLTKNNKCVVYAEQYIQLKKLWYVRGCVSERGSCADIKRGHEISPSISVSSCYECDGNWCNVNGVSRSDLNIVTVLLNLILWPILGKYTLS